MKRLLIVAAAALMTFAATGRAQGPDDRYIEIYRTIQEGDQLAASGQTETAKQRYLRAQEELKKLQASYPQWNIKLVEFRLRTLEQKIGPQQPPAPAEGAPADQDQSQAPVPGAPPQPRTPSAAPGPQAEVDDRDHQIRGLQQQVARLQNDRAVLEAKLREALSARPAAVDPRELNKAEARIEALEKEKEVLRVSLELVEANVSKNGAGAADLRAALAEAKQQLAEQSEAVGALRQEKEILQRRLAAASRPDQEAIGKLQTENQTLRAQLAQQTSAPQQPDAQMEKELTSTKAALQSTRDTMASLQIRLRTLQEERDQLEKTRKNLENRLASTAATPAPVDASQLRRLQNERDALQRQLDETARQLAENKSRSKQAGMEQASEELVALRAKVSIYEARKVPYTAEELAFFKKPVEPILVAAAGAATPPRAATRELPESAAPLLAEAHRAFTARRFSEAEEKYLEVLKLDDGNVSTLQRLAATQLEQTRPKDAEATLARALSVNPDDPRTLLMMGIAKFDQDQYDEALTHLSRSAQLDPENAEAQNYLGITLSQKGQRAAAETALRKAIQLSPSYSSAHYNLAVIYAMQQPPFTELARWHYQKALAFGHPNNPEFEKLIEKKQAASQQ